jgi:hypothetical protein
MLLACCILRCANKLGTRFIHVKPHDNLSSHTHGRSWLPPFPVPDSGATGVHSVYSATLFLYR